MIWMNNFYTILNVDAEQVTFCRNGKDNPEHLKSRCRTWGVSVTTRTGNVYASTI